MFLARFPVPESAGHAGQVPDSWVTAFESLVMVDVGFLSRKPVVCPVCSDEVATRPKENGFGHFATHLEDTRGAGSSLRLGCGSPDAVFDAMGNFPREVMSHLSDRHHLKVPVA